MRTSTFTATVAASALVLTACGSGEGDGIGNTDALSSVEFHSPSEGEREVILHSPIESEEPASRLLSAGDGEQVEDDAIMEFRIMAVDPSDGTVLDDTFDDPDPSIFWLPSILESGLDIDEFFYDALTTEGVTEGSQLAVFHPGNPEQGFGEQLVVLEVENQYPAYAQGEAQEQSGDLPEIDSQAGERPELVDHDSSQDAPDELSSEVLIAGEGEEVAEDDTVVFQYRGWRWEDGEEFDTTWDEEGDGGRPVSFPLQNVIEGWTEGISGHREGDRILLVVPADMAYGDTVDEEEGTSEGGRPGGTLIFVVDIVQSFSPAALAGQQPAEPGAEISEEELEELLEGLEQEEADGEQPEDDESVTEEDN